MKASKAGVCLHTVVVQWKQDSRMCVWKGRSTAADAAYDMPGKTEQKLPLRAFTGEEDPACCVNQSHAFLQFQRTLWAFNLKHTQWDTV